MEIDPLARSFEGAAEEYEAGRPDYPAAAIEGVAAELDLGSASTVVDLGAGTGKLTRGLAERFGRVIAVDPLEGMLSGLRAALPDVEAHVGAAEEIPLEDGVADAIFCGQAFHWFANAQALAEIARVLRPGGGLALIWNLSPWEMRLGSWFAALDDLLEASRADLSVVRRHATGVWREAFAADELFCELRGAEYEHSQRISRQGFMQSLASRSYLASLEAGEREEILQEIRGLMEREDSPWRAAVEEAGEGGAEEASFEGVVPLRTLVFWTHRTMNVPR
jgi:ubiquinone/menaquinone biosynthesis C-methylase UbiE